MRIRDDIGAVLQAARVRQGLSPGAVARVSGLSEAWYRDIEAYPREAHQNTRLGNLVLALRSVGLDGDSLFTEVPSDERRHRVSANDLASALRGAVEASGKSVAEAEELCGWQFAEVLSDSATVWEWNLDQFVAVLETFGVDWAGFLLTGNEVPSRFGAQE